MMICPICNKPLEYMKRGEGVIMHLDVGECMFNVTVGHVSNRAAKRKWREEIEPEIDRIYKKWGL